MAKLKKKKERKKKMAKLTTEHNQVDRKSVCSYTMGSNVSSLKPQGKIS